MYQMWKYLAKVKGFHHGLRTPREEIVFTARPKTQSQSQIFRYGGRLFCLPHRPNFSDISDLCLHWVSVVCDLVFATCCVRQSQDSLAVIQALPASALAGSKKPHVLSKECDLNCVICDVDIDFSPIISPLLSKSYIFQQKVIQRKSNKQQFV